MDINKCTIQISTHNADDSSVHTLHVWIVHLPETLTEGSDHLII